MVYLLILRGGKTSLRLMNGGFFMAYILDIAVILIFVLAIFIGYRRGFVKSIIRLVG